MLDSYLYNVPILLSRIGGGEMSRQNPYISYQEDNQKYKKTLFVDVGLTFEKVNAKIIEPYVPPTPIPKVARLDITNGPSHIHHSGIAVYKTSFSLLFPDRRSYVEYIAYVGGTHKFYDERGQIYIGTVEDVKPRAVEANRRYILDVSLILVKKDQYDRKDFFKFQDIEGHWAEKDISEMANLGILAVTTVDGEPVLYFRPNDFVTRGEFIALLNRTRRLLEKMLRE